MSVLDSRFSCNICFEAVQEPVVTQCGHLYCWPCLYRWLEPGMLPEERRTLQFSSRATSAESLSSISELWARGSTTHLVVDETRRVCPVCKAPCTVPSVVPIYTSTSCASHASPSIGAASTTGHSSETLHAVAGIPSENLSTNEEPSSPASPSSPPCLPHDDTPLISNHQGLRQRFVPARPAANTPQRSGSTVATTRLAPSSPPPRASLGLALQQALLVSAPPTSTIGNADPGTSDFLSRILLILGSFVILCLLLF